MAEDAIRGYIESLKKHGEPLPFGFWKSRKERLV